MMNTTHLRKTASAENEQPTMLDDIVLDRRQRDAYAQWLSLASDSHGTPLRSGFRPEQSRHAMPAGMLLHAGRSSGEMALWQRIEGRLVSLAFGEGDGQRLDTIYNAQFLAHFVPRLLETAITGLPCMTKDSVSTHSGEDFRYTRLILPFREECGDISRLFVVFGFEPAALSMLDEPLPVRRREADPAVEYHGSTKRRRA